MKRRAVLTMTVAIALAGCGGTDGDGGTASNTRTETADRTTESAETHGTTQPSATETDTPWTERETEATPADAPPRPTTASTDARDGTPDQPIPDAPADSGKRPRLAGEADVTLEDGGSRVVVTGTIVGQNGCQTAVLDSTRRTNSRLVITVATERKGATAAACSMALVDIEYRFTVRADRPPESVTVVHRGAGGRQTVYTAATNAG